MATDDGVQAAVQTWVEESIDASDDRHAVFVARADGEVVGVVSVSEQQHWSGQVDAYVGELVTAEAWERRGVGRALLARAEQWARDRGLDRVTPRDRSRQHPSPRLLRATGLPGRGGPAHPDPGADMNDVRIDLLADHPELVTAVGRLRWTEWGYDDPTADSWIAVTRREAGRDGLPVTLVAVAADGSALGAVGLDDADDALTDDERDGRTPWLVGLVVSRDQRRRGVGRALVQALEALVRDRGHDHVWVVTGGDAADFYRACGWRDAERLVTAREGLASTVLVADLTV